MLNYTTRTLDVNSTVFTVTGRNIAHGKRSAVERALLAADLHLDRLALIRPTVTQVAPMLKVCVPYITAAIAIAHDEQARAAVLSGRVPLVIAGWSEQESLTERYLRASSEERVNLTQTAGVDNLWDELIAPAL